MHPIKITKRVKLSSTTFSTEKLRVKFLGVIINKIYERKEKYES